MGKQLIQTPIGHLFLFQRHLDFFYFPAFHHLHQHVFVLVLSVCVVCASAVVGVNSTDRPSAIQFQSIQCTYFLLDPIPESSLALFVTECRSVLSVSPSLPGCAHVAAWLSHVGGVLGAAHGEKFGSEGGVKLLRVLVDSLDASG